LLSCATSSFRKRSCDASVLDALVLLVPEVMTGLLETVGDEVAVSMVLTFWKNY